MAKILVVDDSKFVVTALTAALGSFGHAVVAHGADGNEGFALYKEHQPDLTLLDITMPNRDGRDCLIDIIEHDPNAKVVMISAIKEQDIVDFCMQQGAQGFIQKPLQIANAEYMDNFSNTIDQVLESEQALS